MTGVWGGLGSGAQEWGLQWRDQAVEEVVHGNVISSQMTMTIRLVPKRGRVISSMNEVEA